MMMHLWWPMVRGIIYGRSSSVLDWWNWVANMSVPIVVCAVQVVCIDVTQWKWHTANSLKCYFLHSHNLSELGHMLLIVPVFTWQYSNTTSKTTKNKKINIWKQISVTRNECSWIFKLENITKTLTAGEFRKSFVSKRHETSNGEKGIS